MNTIARTVSLRMLNPTVKVKAGADPSGVPQARFVRNGAHIRPEKCAVFPSKAPLTPPVQGDRVDSLASQL